MPYISIPYSGTGRFLTGKIGILVIWAILAFALPARSDTSFVNSIGMRFVRIPAGTFTMGSPSSEVGRKWDERRHQVVLTRSFSMAITEVTQAQWITVMGTNPSFFQECGMDCPVETVSFNQSLEFIASLNRMENTEAYRLPTEAEWEYACRAGGLDAFCIGPITATRCDVDPILDQVGWYCGNSGVREPVVYQLAPHGVALKKPNAWGLYDMHGNVHEWVMDACKPRGLLRTGVVNDTYDLATITDPLSVKGPNRIFRGGAWNSSTRYCRSANRGSFKPSSKRSYIGFRVVRSP